MTARLFDDSAIASFNKRLSQHKIDYCHLSIRGETLLAYARTNHSAEKLHKINSVTKSVVSLLVGIAIDRGEIAGVDRRLGDYIASARGTDKEAVTIDQLLTMTPGWDWPEMGEWGGRPFPMINSMNWVRFILSRPMTHEPGTFMRYDSGSSHLLSYILQEATGMSTSAYAEKHLFKPLGITRYRWYVDSKGIVIGGFGLELCGPDLAKLGQLALQGGDWQDKRIVSPEWIASSSQPLYHTYDHIGSYGRHWWIMTDEHRVPVSPGVRFAMGYGGQYVFIVPEHGLVATFCSTMYKSTFQPMRLFRELLGV